MKLNCGNKQRGAVVVIVAIALPVLLFAMGWALDFGHVFVNKTRLQNALDATALSAAIAINYDVNKDTAAATTKGKDTFNSFIGASDCDNTSGNLAPGNKELACLNANDLVFDYSRTLDPWASFNPTPADSFAFVKVTSTNMLNVTPWLIKIFRPDDITVPAIATAGPVGQNCSLVPFVMCANMNPLDKDCSDGTCYGYTVGKISSLIRACNGAKNSCPPNSLESGNYGLLNLDGLKGGKDIKCALAPAAKGCNDPGYRNTCTAGGDDTALETKPGYTWGDVKQGINDRLASDSDTTEYHKYDNKGEPINYNPSPYHQYETNKKGNNRRIMGVPIGNCTGLQNGNTELPQVGTACMFLTEKVIDNDPKTGIKKAVMAEFTGDSCQQNGVWDPNNPVLNGPYKIVLFKSWGSGDA
jgi:Flp pilus assembly protein TadG